jgi:ribonuclease P protein component
LQTEEEKEEKDFQPDDAIDNGLLAFDTLKKKSDFEKLKKEGKVLKDKHLILYILPNKEQHTLRAGFGIGKKTGKAFQRNKIKRILKEILRKVSIPFAIDVFIIARNTITGAGYSELKEELEKNLKEFFLSK